jgi:hypothetical protein
MTLSRIALYLFAAIVMLLHGYAHASKVSIPLNDPNFRKMPPSDLVYQGKRIDEVDALELQKSGIDISKLNPYEDNNLWKNRKLPASNISQLKYPTEKSVLVFSSFKKSPAELFRATVRDKLFTTRKYTLSATLDSHTNILRAGLLRMLGYDIDTPKYYKKLTIEFASKEEREKFIELVGEQTLTKRDKWVEKKVGDKKLIVKGFTIEPAKLRNVNIHLPLMSRDRQQERRIFRALLEVYTLTDFPQAINKIGWQTGRVFNDKLIFNHPYAREFKNVTVQDLQWVHRRITNLSEKEIREAVKLCGYPEDIEALVSEKLFSRINRLGEYLSLDKTTKKFPENRMITIGNVKGGKLTDGEYEGYVVDFHDEDPLSPYRFRELFRLFRTQLTYASLSSALDYATSNLLPGRGIDDAILSIQEKMTEYRQENPQAGGALPIKSWSSPIASGRVFANRNIVFGQYLGMNAPIQLVDSVGAEATLGVFTNISGMPANIMPSITTSASIGRTYIHVRAMPDLKTASKQKISNILVPRLLKKLGRVIKDEFECSIPAEAWVDETDINGDTIYYVKYDEERENGREEAIAKRKELIETGIEAGKILLVKIKRDELCVDEIAETRTNNLEEFLKQFAMNESFIINDSIRLGSRLGAPIPIPALQGLSISLGAEAQVALLRGVVVRRTEEGIEVTVQQQRDLKRSLDEGLNYFVEIMRNKTQWTNGRLFSKVYKIPLEDINDEKKELALRALREIFVDSDHDLMKENYPPYELDHRVRSRLNTFRILWYKSEKLKMDHTVDLLVPQKEGQDFSKEERTRTLFSTMIMRRKGNDFYTFVDRILSGISGFLSIGSNDGDPGQSFLGKSKKRYYTTEAELTKGYPLNALTKVEYIYTGWKIKSRKLTPIFDEIEDMFLAYVQRDLINRGEFHASPQLRSYDIRATIILYPGAFEKIQKYLFHHSERTAINTLRNLYGHDEWDEYCYRANDFFGSNGPQSYYGERHYSCVPPAVQKMLRFRRKSLPDNRVKLTKKINEIMENMMDNFRKDELLAWIGKKNFFASTRVTGFREQHYEGYVEHISDTVGEYNTKIGTGVFDQISSYFGLSPYELRALNYTPGM